MEDLSGRKDHVEIEYDREDCSLEYQQSEEQKPLPPLLPKNDGDTERVLLEPDHPLLAKFQQTLKDQLERQFAKLSCEVNELEISIKKKTVERDALGVRVYDSQQMITLQHESIDHFENEIKKITTDRYEMESELTEIRDNYKESRDKFNQSEKKELELRNELETINFLLQKMTEWENKLQSDLAVNQRIADKSKIDKKQFAEEKRNLDFIIYKLMTEVFRLENSMEHLDMQLRVKEHERENLATSISDANADIESLEFEHKRLMHSWNCVLVAIGHRDKMYMNTKKDLELSIIIE